MSFWAIAFALSLCLSAAKASACYQNVTVYSSDVQNPNLTYTDSTTGGAKLVFRFTGVGLAIFGAEGCQGSDTFTVTLDNNATSFTCIPGSNSSDQAVWFSITGLNDTLSHTVEICNPSGSYSDAVTILEHEIGCLVVATPTNFSTDAGCISGSTTSERPQPTSTPPEPTTPVYTNVPASVYSNSPAPASPVNTPASTFTDTPATEVTNTPAPEATNTPEVTNIPVSEATAVPASRSDSPLPPTSALALSYASPVATSATVAPVVTTSAPRITAVPSPTATCAPSSTEAPCLPVLAHAGRKINPGAIVGGTIGGLLALLALLCLLLTCLRRRRQNQDGEELKSETDQDQDQDEYADANSQTSTRRPRLRWPFRKRREDQRPVLGLRRRTQEPVASEDSPRSWLSRLLCQ